jgi:hypothetical protein
LLLGGLFYGLLSGTPATALAESDVATHPNASPDFSQALQDTYPEGVPDWDTDSKGRSQFRIDGGGARAKIIAIDQSLCLMWA